MSESNIKYLVIAHGDLASELLKTLTFIAGERSNFIAATIDHELDVDDARAIARRAIEELAQDASGVIVLTDLFGGTPSNIAMGLSGVIPDIDIEIIAGVNMPILLQAALSEPIGTTAQVAAKLREHGQRNIFLASDLLRSKKNT